MSERFAQVTEADLALSISSNALRVLALLRIRCWSPEGPKARELTYADMRESLPLGRDAIATAVRELVDAGLVTATARPGNRWRYAIVDVAAERVDGPLPSLGRSSAKGRSFRSRRKHQPAQPADTNRLTRSRQPGEPAASTGSPGCISRVSRHLTGEVDLVDPVDQQVDAAAAVIDLRDRLGPERAAYVDALERRAEEASTSAVPGLPPAPRPGPAVEGVALDLDAVRREVMGECQGAARLRVGAAKLHLRAEGAAANLARAVDEHGRDIVAEVLRFGWREVAAGRAEPNHVGYAFRRDAGWFAKLLEDCAKIRALEERQAAREAAKARSLAEPAPEPEGELWVPPDELPAMFRRPAKPWTPPAEIDGEELTPRERESFESTARAYSREKALADLRHAREAAKVPADQVFDEEMLARYRRRFRPPIEPEADEKARAEG